MRKSKARATIAHPSKPEEWQEKLRSFSMRIGFVIALTRPMLEFLSATADDVRWDRAIYNTGQANLNSYLTTAASLEKRGLIVHVGIEEVSKRPCLQNQASYKLTPAGALVVKLLKFAGLFVQSDAAIGKKKRMA